MILENEYSVPYFWGTVGIVYDKTKVDTKTWKKKAIIFSWIRNIKGTSTCMIQREIPL